MRTAGQPTVDLARRRRSSPMPPAGELDRLEQAAVVGHDEQGAVVAVERRFELLDGRAGRGGWWARRAPGSSRPGPRSGRARPACARPGESVPARRGHVVGARARTWRAASGRRRPCSPVAARNASSSGSIAGEPGARLVHLPDDDARAHPPLPGRERQTDRAARAAAWSCPSRSGRRSPRARPSRSRGRPARGGTRRAATTAPRRRITTSPLRGALATWNRRSHPSHGFSTASRRSIAFSVARAFAACFSDVATRKCRMILSFSDVSLLRRADALHRPLALRARALLEPAALGAVRRRSPPRRAGGPWRARRGSPASRRRTRCRTGCARRARAPG